MFTSMIERVNALGAAWAAWFGGSIVDAAIVLTLAGAIWLLARKKASIQLGYCLFLLVLVKLFVPLEVAVPEKVARWMPARILQDAWTTSATSQHNSPDQPLTASRGGESPTLFARQPIEPVRDYDSSPVVADTSLESVVARDDSPAAGSPLPTAAPAAEHTTPLSLFGGLMIAWAAVACLLLARFLRVQWRFHRRLRGAKEVDLSVARIDFGELCDRLGLRRRVNVVESPEMASPAVWGVLRPVLILPDGLVGSVSGKPLEWILLHELAHVRRHDLAVACFQRLATILHFINPAVWVANRMINRLREYACDDAALAASGGSPLESGEAFMWVVRRAAQRRLALGASMDGALGVFDSDARTTCFQRMARLLDADRRLRVRLGFGSLCLLLVMAALTLPQLRAAGEDKPEPPAVVEQKPANAPLVSRPFELTVVGPNGKAVPNARVEIRTRPRPKEWTITRGTALKPTEHGMRAITGPDGKVAFLLSNEDQEFLTLDIATDRFGPFWAEWDSSGHAEPIPANYTAHLDAGQLIGGIVVNDEGKPVEGVELHARIRYKKREGDRNSLIGGARLKTDAQGRWSCESVPAAMEELSLEIAHPEYKSKRLTIPTKEFTIAKGQSPVAKIVLDRGIAVTGKITDETGAAIAGAVVRAKFLYIRREATTDNSGIYRLGGCERGQTDVVAMAKGRAPELKNVNIKRAMPPVDFQLEPGRTIRVRVVDAGGKPVPETHIFFQSWRGDDRDCELGAVHEYTDPNGVWEWHEAPADEVVCAICPPGGMELANQSLVARQEEYVFTALSPLIVSGRVVDAETKLPVKEFRVVPGFRSSKNFLNWTRDYSSYGREGSYRIKQVSPALVAHQIMIEANGYLPGISRDIKSNEGSVTIDFQLQKGKDVKAVVLMPDGKPAKGADVALGVPGSHINIFNGFLDHAIHCERRVTDAEGHFSFPPPTTPFQLIIMHPAGCAVVETTSELSAETIRLQPWARIEGTSAANIQITMEGPGSYDNDMASISLSNQATTDANGRFRFDRIVPGTWSMGREIVFGVTQESQRRAWSHRRRITLSPGETKRVEIGGKGRPIIGKLVPPEGLSPEIDWSFSVARIESRLASLSQPPIIEEIKNDAKKLPAWWAAWAKTDVGRAGPRLPNEIEPATSTFAAAIGHDGVFRVEDVPAGEYVLTVQLERVPEYRGDRRLLAILRRDFTVASMENGRSDEPLDLGVLNLEKPTVATP